MEMKIKLSRAEVEVIVKAYVLESVKMVGVELMEVHAYDSYGSWTVDILEPEKEVSDDNGSKT